MPVVEAIEKKYTIEAYLQLESRAKHKHEFYNGYVKKRPGASVYHNIIAANILVALSNCLEDKNYMVLTAATKINISRLKSFVYPDAVVVCEKPEFYEGRTDVITNPLLIVEVSSPATKYYDRIGKFEHYKTLSSFKEYVRIEQTMP